MRAALIPLLLLGLLALSSEAWPKLPKQTKMMKQELRPLIPGILKTLEYATMAIDLANGATVTRELTQLVFDHSITLRLARWAYPPLETHIHDMIAWSVKKSIKSQSSLSPKSLSRFFRLSLVRFLGDTSESTSRRDPFKSYEKN